MKSVIVVAAVVSSFLLSGCDSSQDASESNFKKVINEKLAKQCIAFSPVRATLSGYPSKPFSVYLANPGTQVLNDTAEDFNAKQLALPNAFVKAGVLSVKDGEANVGLGNHKKTKEFSLTDEGRKYLKDPKSIYFCVGHYQVDEIVDFTKPSDAFGMTMSQVRYKFSPVDLPEWAKSEDLKNGLKELSGMQTGRITLVLKNNGWSAEK